jgi:predicted kinase
MSEIAFMFMDLLEHDRISLAYIFLNEYLSKTGDYTGLQLLSYYIAYRSMVRAKIQLFTMDTPDCDEKLMREQFAKYRKYARLAEKSLRPPNPQLFVMNGLSGSGKSTFASFIAEDLCAIQLRSDVLRTRITETQNLSKYAPETHDLIYNTLADLAKQILMAGYSVVLDATYLKKPYRDQVIALAKELNIPITLIRCEASVDHLHAAVEARKQNKDNVSDANKKVIASQIENQDPLTPEEMKLTLKIQSDQSLSRDEFLILLKNFIEKRGNIK